jgi:GT2 family glycosyltransferase
VNTAPRKVLSVVILGWNGIKYLQQFLPSVVSYSSHPDYEVVYIDNCSSDESVAYVRMHHPSVRIIINPSNDGFAGGYNLGLSQLDSEYYLLLNQDVEVTAGWLEPMLDTARRHQAAAVQPKLRAYYSRADFEYAGASGGYVDWLGYAFCRGRIFDHIETDTGQYQDEQEIFWASGAAMLVRSDLYWQVGGLDADFFAHQEEIDLCWRIKNLGYKIYVQPQAIVYHVGGGSLPQGNPRKTFLNFRNNLLMMVKNLPHAELAWKLPLRIILDVLAAMWSAAKNRNLKDFGAILKAHWAFYKMLPATFGKRKLIASKHPNLLYPKSVVWAYFIQGKRKFTEL